MSKVPLVYIGGPFRSATAWGVEQNVRRAEELALAVAYFRAMPVCPHTNTRFFDGELSDQFWIDGTLALLRACDAMVLAPRWGESPGTLGEIKEAQKLCMPLFFGVSTVMLGSWDGSSLQAGSWLDFKDWVDGWRLG